MKDAALVLFAVIVFTALPAADRRWQIGTWAQAGVARTPFVGDPVHERMPPGFNRPEMTEVGSYVIETDDRRYYVQSMVPIRSDGFDARVTVGKPVTFAIEKKTAYIALDKGEYRLLVVKSERKKTR
ncbi:MAG TPA: hypothetical protein VKB50_05585 [Vicinamibacterales bacterium]|nr:hypothetical protein [Vicinamibacterales bacterium]